MKEGRLFSRVVILQPAAWVFCYPYNLMVDNQHLYYLYINACSLKRIVEPDRLTLPLIDGIEPVCGNQSTI